MLQYISDTPQIKDVVVSGGDAYMLDPKHLHDIGEELVKIPHLKRIRIASKGLAVCPMRITDKEDYWAKALLEVHAQGRKQGVHVALHTHFNHPSEITWVTKLAAQKLFEQGLTVRNQTVLLRGINDDLETMSTLIHGLADINIQPYYVYQGDMVKGVEDLRTPLWKILDLEQQLLGTIAGFMMPKFVVDLPGGGGKRPAHNYMSYDRSTGVSVYTAPGVEKRGGPDQRYYYHDPMSQEGHDRSAIR